MSDTLLSALVLIPALIFAIVFHEVSHGWSALALGDTTARDMRRLSLNPIRHVDPLGTVILPGALALLGAPVFGWAKPVPVNARRLRNPRYGMMAVAAAGPASNLVLAAIAAVGLGLLGRGLQAQPEGALALAMMGLNYFILINIFLALFNLLPIPPFDGSHIVEGLLPRDAARAYAKLRPLGLPLVFLLLLVLPSLIPGFDLIGRFLTPVVMRAQDFYYSIAAWAAGG
ncbi:site-2 protease family protein [Altererythrobacter sp. CC-YST694]|uniref:site-2 protease family protein n=1 Tax=Altererythrobacter sp. CC-YST694 TaxID=2755038 RepID=UPI001D02C9FD|nr:site-2 protease family protein [Altererythrobacter sp. CC-YST694]MCB5426376.1 site-2 protease family protein [Altererythrobacter sp. CC-YST694]